MAKLDNLFTFKPHTKMMMGSCAAALLAALVIIPMASDGVFEYKTEGKFSEVAEPLGNDVTSRSEPVVTQPSIPAPKPKTPTPTDEIRKSDTQPAVPQISQPPVQVKPNQPEMEATSVLPAGGTSSVLSDAKSSAQQRVEELDSETDQLSRELRNIASTNDKATITPQAQMETRQRVKTPARTIERIIPPVTKEVTRRVKKDDGTFTTVKETIVIQPQGVDYINVPAEYETYTESVVTQEATIKDMAAKRLTTMSTVTSLPGGVVLEEVPAQYKAETKTIVTKEASTELVITPPVYETITETIVTQEASTELITIPAEYEWVDGEIEGSSVEYVHVPAEYETIMQPVVAQEAKTELVTIPPTYNSDGTIAVPARIQERVIPAVTKMETRRVVKTPARTVERIVPNEIRDGKTRIVVTPSRTMEKVIPALPKQVERRVIKTPASTIERVVPAGTEIEAIVKTQISPQKFYLRDENGNIIREFASRDQFEDYQRNKTTSVKTTPVSTFSIDVDTASYSFFRSSINRGQLPPPSSIRLEEMINYFPYDYQAPDRADEPFKANVTVTPTPWNADTKLMHIGIKGYVPQATEKPRSNIVFLIDTSGSMQAANKLPLLVNSFKLLLNTLDDDDTVSIVTYAGNAGTVLEPTPASDKGAINEALNRLRAGGSTAGAAGLELAYLKAQESFDDEGVNRVILATDGDFNVGFSSPEDMKNFIAKKRDTGIFLSVLGFGNDNYNDHLMQSLAQNGNGVAAYIDSLAEANKVLANEAGSALFTIAKDVKIQVEFNPATIAEYRLIGYETRALNREDFNNDKVDAGEINAGHTVTAIYEMTPIGSRAVTIDDLRYASDEVDPVAAGSDEYAFVKIRHKLPNADKSTLQTFPIGEGQERSMRRASNDMRFATAVAAAGQKLRGDSQVSDYSYENVIKLAQGAKGEDGHGYRAEFIQLMRLVESMER